MGQVDRLQEKAFSLLASASTASAFDLADEPVALRERYGQTINGMSLLMARRLVEAEVPFITVFWKEEKEFFSMLTRVGRSSAFVCLL